MRLTNQEKYAAQLVANNDPLADAKLVYTVMQSVNPDWLYDRQMDMARYQHIYTLGRRYQALRRAKKRRIAREGIFRPEFV